MQQQLFQGESDIYYKRIVQELYKYSFPPNFYNHMSQKILSCLPLPKPDYTLPQYLDPINPWVQAAIVSVTISGVWPSVKVQIADKESSDVCTIFGVAQCGKQSMTILASPFDWYHLTTLTHFNLRYHYCETTNFEELISNAHI